MQSYLRISDQPIYSDLIPLGKADLILSVEPMEALRYLPYLKPDGYVVTNSTPFVNIPNYPATEELMHTLEALPHRIILDADTLAKEKAGNIRAGNFIMLGAASPFINIPFEYLEEGIRAVFSRKGEEIIGMNLKALHAGRDFALKA